MGIFCKWTQEEESQVGFQMVLRDCHASSERERLCTEAPLRDSPDGGEGESSRWAELGELRSFCLQGEVAGRKGLHQIMVWLESGTGRSTMKKWKGLKKRSEDRAL